MRLFIRGSYAVASDRAVFPVAVNKSVYFYVRRIRIKEKKLLLIFLFIECSD
jgi:hypothetical protein